MKKVRAAKDSGSMGVDQIDDLAVLMCQPQTDEMPCIAGKADMCDGGYILNGEAFQHC